MGKFPWLVERKPDETKRRLRPNDIAVENRGRDNEPCVFLFPNKISDKPIFYHGLRPIRMTAQVHSK